MQVGERRLAVLDVHELDLGAALIEPSLHELGVVEIVLDQQDPKRAPAVFALGHLHVIPPRRAGVKSWSQIGWRA